MCLVTWDKETRYRTDSKVFLYKNLNILEVVDESCFDRHDDERSVLKSNEI